MTLVIGDLTAVTQGTDFPSPHTEEIATFDWGAAMGAAVCCRAGGAGSCGQQPCCAEGGSLGMALKAPWCPSWGPPQATSREHDSAMV